MQSKEIFFQFDEANEIDENDEHYRRNPTICDKMHCILFVAKADNIEEGVDFTVLQNIQRYLSSKSKDSIKMFYTEQ